MASRVISGFVFGAASGVAALKLSLYEEQKTGSSVHRLIECFGLPQTSAETRFYMNHVLSYDQTLQTPRWVQEHLSTHRLLASDGGDFLSVQHRPAELREQRRLLEQMSLRLEIYCRELMQRFGDGPLLLPQTQENGRRTVCYQLSQSDSDL